MTIRDKFLSCFQGKPYPYHHTCPSYSVFPTWCFHLEQQTLCLSPHSDSTCPTKGSQPPQVRIQLASYSRARDQPPALRGGPELPAMLQCGSLGQTLEQGQRRDKHTKLHGTKPAWNHPAHKHKHTRKQLLPLTEIMFLSQQEGSAQNSPNPKHQTLASLLLQHQNQPGCEKERQPVLTANPA